MRDKAGMLRERESGADVDWELLIHGSGWILMHFWLDFV